MDNIEKKREKLDLDGLNVEVISLEVEKNVKEEMPWLDPNEEDDLAGSFFQAP